MRLSTLCIHANLSDVEFGIRPPDMPGLFEAQKELGSANTFT